MADQSVGKANDNPMAGLTEGRIVHYVMPDGAHRPAIVVQVWRHRGPDDENGEVWLVPENGVLNLQVFTDGSNDVPYTTAEKEAYAKSGMNPEAPRGGLLWATSAVYSSKPEPHTWHWIERA